MKTPNFTPKHDTFAYWQPVEQGRIEPDEYQTAMMNLVRTAKAEGLFYNRDIEKYVREHAEFIPSEAWNMQPERRAVEGGLMGYETYFAGVCIREQQLREKNQNALKTLAIGQILGTLKVNGKRINKCVIVSIDGIQVKMTAMAGAYSCTITTTAASIQGMIDGAVERKWRKAIDNLITKE